MREGPTHGENETDEVGREKEIERYPPRKTFGWPRKTTKEVEKLGDERERHLVTLAWIKASICEGIYLVSFKKTITNWFKVILGIYSRALNGLNEGGFRLCFMYGFQFITLNIFFGRSYIFGKTMRGVIPIVFFKINRTVWNV